MPRLWSIRPRKRVRRSRKWCYWIHISTLLLWRCTSSALNTKRGSGNEQIYQGNGPNFPWKWLKFTKEMAQISPGNGSGSPGNVSWGPGYMPGISVNAELSLRATKHTTVKVVKIICLLLQVCFPDIQGNSSPFLHMFPGRFFWV